MCCPRIKQSFVWTWLVNSMTWSYMGVKSYKNLWRSASPSTLLKAGSTGASCSELSMSKGGDSTTFQGTKSQYLTLTVEKYFHIFKLNFLYFFPVLFHLLLLASCSVTELHWETSGPVFLTHSHQEFIYIHKPPSQPFLLQAEQSHFLSPHISATSVP